ncbi:hypothetical protein Pla110_46010 [Polystyrenella longa]|uniref:Uncharacterized protein n=1 Tax=Polystyrenella longa TaxID=2528007 RepID=A0A518CUF3_9PLAN|nr:hypothetical protein [Polystyrenella longa]QDU82838.1 hypothetical protein Pla110_46010 [Polystyrenella longa]
MSRDRFEDELEYDDGPGPQKSGMSTGMKVFLWILVGGGVCMLICCGVGIYFASNMMSFSDKPADAIATTNEITTISIPQEQFPPKGSMKMDFFGFYSMKMAIYSDENGKGANTLFLMNMQIANLSADEMETSMKDSMGQQGQGNNLQIDSSEVRQIDINGQNHDFTFSEATDKDDGGKFRQIQGTFPAKQGTAFLMMQIPEEDYNEEAVMQMLDSIE